MQTNINRTAKFNPRRYDKLRFSCLMQEEGGHFGEYYCEADTLEGAIEEAKEAAAHYMNSSFGEGDKIVRLLFSEHKADGNSYHAADVQL